VGVFPRRGGVSPSAEVKNELCQTSAPVKRLCGVDSYDLYLIFSFHLCRGLPDVHPSCFLSLLQTERCLVKSDDRSGVSKCGGGESSGKSYRFCSHNSELLRLVCFKEHSDCKCLDTCCELCVFTNRNVCFRD
jgi:hypothetical protein